MRVNVRGLDPDETRWVTPFPVDHPKFKIELRELPTATFEKIARRYGMTPMKPEAKDYESLFAYTRDLFEAQFVSAEGEETFFGKVPPSKQVYLVSSVEFQGGEEDLDRPPCSKCGEIDKALVSQSLWLYIDRIAKRERAKEIKN